MKIPEVDERRRCPHCGFEATLPGPIESVECPRCPRGKHRRMRKVPMPSEQGVLL